MSCLLGHSSLRERDFSIFMSLKCPTFSFAAQIATTNLDHIPWLVAAGNPVYVFQGPSAFALAYLEIPKFSLVGRQGIGGENAKEMRSLAEGSSGP